MTNAQQFVPGQEMTPRRRFGPFGRYAVAPVATRFGAPQWFVWDAETPDGDGRASIIRQESSEARAIAGLDDELATVVCATPDEVGFAIGPPPGESAASWDARSAGFVGDHRPLEARLADKIAKGGAV